MKDITIKPEFHNPIRPTFSITNAIREAVEREDLVRWALKDEPRSLIRGLRHEKAPNKLSTRLIGMLP